MTAFATQLLEAAWKEIGELKEKNRALKAELAAERGKTWDQFIRAEKAEERPTVKIIRDKKLLRQWNHDEPCVQISTPDRLALFPASHVLAIFNWLSQDRRESDASGEASPASVVSPPLKFRLDCNLPCCEGESMKHAKGHYPHTVANPAVCDCRCEDCRAGRHIKCCGYENCDIPEEEEA